MTGSASEDFDAFYVAAVHRVVLYVFAVCGDRAEAQDIAQEAFARAWQHWARVSGYDDPEAWVRVLAWRLTANRWRTPSATATRCCCPTGTIRCRRHRDIACITCGRLPARSRISCHGTEADWHRECPAHRHGWPSSCLWRLAACGGTTDCPLLRALRCAAPRSAE